MGSELEGGDEGDVVAAGGARSLLSAHRTLLRARRFGEKREWAETQESERGGRRRQRVGGGGGGGEGGRDERAMREERMASPEAQCVE